MDVKETTDDKGPIAEIRTETNLEGMMRAVAVAIFKMGQNTRMSDDERMDLISAGLDAVRTTCVDDITHSIGIGEVPDELVVHRLGMLGVGIENVRRSRIDRFFNMCELLKPEFEMNHKYEDRPVQSGASKPVFVAPATADVN